MLCQNHENEMPCIVCEHGLAVEGVQFWSQRALAAEKALAARPTDYGTWFDRTKEAEKGRDEALEDNAKLRKALAEQTALHKGLHDAAASAHARAGALEKALADSKADAGGAWATLEVACKQRDAAEAEVARLREALTRVRDVLVPVPNSRGVERGVGIAGAALSPAPKETP